ncbi:MAG: DUF169 domain-containing protein [Syntrophobacteraceae bacterium]
MNYEVKDYQSIGKKVKEKLQLETEIVSVKFIRDISEIPEGFLRPLKDTGKKMTCCRGMDAARKNGMNVAITADDNPCVVNIGHGWAKVSFIKIIKSQTMNKWQNNFLSVIRVNNARMRLRGIMANWPWSRFLGHRGFLLSPLSHTPFIPDSVVVYGYPEQMAHMCHAFSVEGKHIPRAALTGFGDACWGATLFPLKSGNPVFVLLGLGDRAFGGANKYEVGMGMPGSMIFYMDKHLHKAGGEHNLLEYLKNPPVDVDEDTLPGWRLVRDHMK